MEKLPLVVEDITQIPEAVRPFYAQDDAGKHVLKLSERVVPMTSLDEFRNKNIELLRERDELTKKFEGIDPEAHRRLLQLEQDYKDAKLVNSGQIEELLSQKTKRMREDYETRLGTLEKNLNDEKAKGADTVQELRQTIVQLEASQAINRVGIPKEGVLPYFCHLARNTWQFVEGKLMAMNGDKVLYGADGVKPMTWDEWALEIRKTHSNMFEPSQGGGSRGGGAGGVGNLGAQVKDIPAGERLRMIREGTLQTK